MHTEIVQIATLFIEDVAEDPTRLARAQELATQQISEVIKRYAEKVRLGGDPETLARELCE